MSKRGQLHALGAAILLAGIALLATCLGIRISSGGAHSESIGFTEVDNGATTHIVLCPLGVVEPGSVLEGSAKIINNSSVTWHAKKIQSDCGCVMQSLDPKTIEPSHEATVRYKYTAPTSEARIRRQIVVLFEEQQAGAFVIRLTGASRRVVSINPESIDLGGVLPGHAYIKHLDVLTRVVDDINWPSSFEHAPGVRITAASPSKVTDEMDGKVLQLVHLNFEFLIPSHNDSRTFNGTIQFPIGNEAKYDFKLPYRWHNKDVVSINPNSLFYGYVPVGRVAEADVTISSIDNAITWNSPTPNVSSNLKDQLQVTLSKKSPSDLILHAQYNPKVVGAAEGRVTILNNGAIACEVPIVAFASEGGR